jgi:elongation factor P
MSKITTADFQKGMFIEFKNEPHQIIEFQHVNPGKGSAFVRTKLKAVKTGKVQEFTYKSGEDAEEVPINVREMQYLYKTDTDCVFMDNQSYEQLSLKKELAGNYVNFLKEGDTYQILVFNEVEPLGMRFPKKVRLLVTEAEDAVAGDTATSARKPVTVETGVQINVPLFIKKGDTIAIDPDTSAYLERVSQ